MRIIRRIGEFDLINIEVLLTFEFILRIGEMLVRTKDRVCRIK